MGKVIRILLFLQLINVQLSTRGQNNIYYNKNEVSLNVVDLISMYGREFRIGEHVSLYVISERDTTLLFKSFGCTQTYVNKLSKEVRLYIWPRYFYEKNCICIDWDEKPCRPDTSEADLRIVFDFNDEEVKCHVSKIPFYEYENGLVKAIADSLSKMEYKNYIKLNNFNKLFRRRLYDKSYYMTLYLKDIDNYYDVFFLSNFNEIDLNLLDRNIRYLLKNEDWAIHIRNSYRYIFWPMYNYTRNLIRYIKPMEEKTFKGDKIYEFSSYVLKLYEYEQIYFNNKSE